MRELDSDGEGTGIPYKRLTYLILILVIVAAVLAVLWVVLQWSIAESVYSSKSGLDWFGITFYHDYTFVAAGLFSILLIMYPGPGPATCGGSGQSSTGE